MDCLAELERREHPFACLEEPCLRSVVHLRLISLEEGRDELECYNDLDPVGGVEVDLQTRDRFVARGRHQGSGGSGLQVEQV